MNKRKRGRRLTGRLADEAVLLPALQELLLGTDRAFFCVTRGRLSSETGAPQSTSVVVPGQDAMDSTGRLAASLLRSREVVLVATWPDGGGAVVNLTSRTAVILTNSIAADSKISDFDAALRAEGR